MGNGSGSGLLLIHPAAGKRAAGRLPKERRVEELSKLLGEPVRPVTARDLERLNQHIVNYNEHCSALSQRMKDRNGKFAEDEKGFIEISRYLATMITRLREPVSKENSQQLHRAYEDCVRGVALFIAGGHEDGMLRERFEDVEPLITLLSAHCNVSYDGDKVRGILVASFATPIEAREAKEADIIPLGQYAKKYKEEDIKGRSMADEMVDQLFSEEARRASNLNQLQSTMVRYMASNATRAQLQKGTVKRLDEIRKKGNDLLNALGPFENASVFQIRFTKELIQEMIDAGEQGRPGFKLHQAGIKDLQNDLEQASQFIKQKVKTFPVSDAEVETTCALSALFCLAGFSKYVPDVILESTSTADEKADMAKRFIAFFDREIVELLNPKKKWKNAEELHAAIFAMYNSFKKQNNDLFLMVRKRFGGTDIAEFMAPFGTDFFSWWHMKLYR